MKNIQIYTIPLVEHIEESLYNNLLDQVSADRKKRINRFVKKEDSYRALIGEILVRNKICEDLNMRNNAINMAYNKYGKPYLVDDPGIHFNVSHAGKWIVCAFDKLPVGIDVEMKKQIDYGLAKRFFTKDEYEDLMQLSEDKRTDYFFWLWTLKESFIKAVGMGLSLPLDSFSFRKLGSVIRFENNYSADLYEFKEYYIDDNYKLAVCGRYNNFPEEPCCLSFFDLAQSFLSVYC